MKFKELAISAYELSQEVSVSVRRGGSYRRVKIAGLLVALACVVGSSAASAQGGISNVQTAVTQPNGGLVTFDTSNAMRGWVEYGTSCSSTNLTSNGQAEDSGFGGATDYASNNHMMWLSGLDSGTTYYYRVFAEYFDDPSSRVSSPANGDCHFLHTKTVAAGASYLECDFEPGGACEFVQTIYEGNKAWAPTQYCAARDSGHSLPGAMGFEECGGLTVGEYLVVDLFSEVLDVAPVNAALERIELSWNNNIEADASGTSTDHASVYLHWSNSSATADCVADVSWTGSSAGTCPNTNFDIVRMDNGGVWEHINVDITDYIGSGSDFDFQVKFSTEIFNKFNTWQGWLLDNVSVATVTLDADGDGISDENGDVCPFFVDPGQADGDYDGLGDACDDTDGDGTMDNADSNIDGDQWDNASDTCPFIWTDDNNGNVCDVQSMAALYSVASQDGFAREEPGNTNQGDAVVKTKKINIGDLYQNKQIKGFVSFNVPALPAGAVLTTATLKMTRAAILRNPNSDLGNMAVDISVGGFGGDPALVASDFEADATASNVGQLSTGTNATAVIRNPNVLQLLENPGVVQFRIYHGLDDDGDFNADRSKYFDGAASNVEDRPQLLLNYVLP